MKLVNFQQKKKRLFGGVINHRTKKDINEKEKSV